MNRTTPQIRRCLENWMVKTDRETLERYRLKSLGWKKDSKAGKLSPIIAYGPEETIAYAHYFFPSRCGDVFLSTLTRGCEGEALVSSIAAA